MNGKQKVLVISAITLVGVAVICLILTTFYQSDELAGRLPMETTSTRFLSEDNLNASPSEVVDQFELTNTPTYSVPLLNATFSGDDADVYVSSYSGEAGKNSITGEVRSARGLAYTEEMIETDRGEGVLKKHVEVTSLLEHHEDEMGVSIIGLATSSYVFKGEYRDLAGNAYKFEYATTTNRSVVDTYEYDLISGSISVTRTMYPNWHEEETMLLPGLAKMECDVEALQSQLVALLKEKGWRTEDLPPPSFSVSWLKEKDNFNRTLPFGYEGVCQLTVTFETKYEDVLPENRPDISRLAFSNESVTSGNITFTPDFADGPMASLAIRPLLSESGAIQFLSTESYVTFIKFGYLPDSTSCPCWVKNKAAITSPLWPND
jgi:hypothetical protein